MRITAGKRKCETAPAFSRYLENVFPKEVIEIKTERNISPPRSWVMQLLRLAQQIEKRIYEAARSRHCYAPASLALSRGTLQAS